MDNKELIDMVEIHGKAIYGFCYNLTKNKTDTDDLYQDTFLKAMELLHKIDSQNSPKSFLMSIAVGLWKNKRRKYAWRQRIAPTDQFDDRIDSVCQVDQGLSPEEIVIEQEICMEIQQAADSLNDKLKIPLYMYYTAQMSISEIALALNIPDGTVKTRLHKARKAMKNILEVSIYEEFRTI